MSDITVSVTDDTDISLTVSPSADLSSSTTDNLTEGSSNLYHTSERVDDRVNALLQAGSNITLTYDDTANTLTIASTDTEDNLSNNTTSDLAEGSNLYFTDARVDTALTTVGGHILPATDDTHDLGSTTKRWRELYLGPSSLFIDNVQLISSSATNMDFTTTAAGNQNIRLIPDGELFLTPSGAKVTVGASGTELEVNGSFDMNGTADISGTLGVGGILTASNRVKTNQIDNIDSNGLTLTTSNIFFVDLNETNSSNTGKMSVGSASQAVGIDGTSIGASAGTAPNITANNLTVNGTLSGIDTGDVTEGSNLYFTNARADARITNNILDEDNFASDSATNTASQQSIKAYIATQIATKDNTDEITEGSTNLYFTTARARSSISASGSLAYNSSTGALTYTQGAIDADSVTVSNLEVDNLKSGVLDTDLSSVAGTDTTLASAKAIKSYVDAQILTKDNTDEITEGSSNLYFTDARARAVSIENVVEDTSPQLGGNLDLNSNNITGTGNIDTTGSLTLSGDITGDSGDFNVVNSVDGSGIVMKIDDTGGTTHTGLTVKEDDYTKSSSTHYKSFILQNEHGIKIGDSGEFSATGGAPNNADGNYRINGAIINPTGNTWPSVNVVSTGQGTNANPLIERFGAGFAGGGFDDFPNGNFLFSAANGTSASPTALGSGKRVGQLGFLCHDGSSYGGTGAVASASLTVTSAEAASTSNARGVNMIFDFLPIGGASGDGDNSSDRKTALTLDHDTFQVGTSSNDVPSQFYGNATFEDNITVSGKIDGNTTFDDNATVEGNLQVDGDTTLGNGSSDEVLVNGRLTDHLITNNISNLGSTSQRWGVLYAEGLNINANQIDFTALPTSDPGVAGRLFRSGNDVKISTG